MQILVLAIKRGIWLAVALLLYGCSSTLQTGRYQTFRTATDGIYSSTPDKPLAVDAFKPVINRQSFDITDELNKRTAAVSVLDEAISVIDAGKAAITRVTDTINLVAKAILTVTKVLA